MMRHLLSDRIGDFAAMYDEDIELVSVARPESTCLEALADELFASRQVVQAEWEQAAGDRDAPMSALPATIDDQYARALSAEIARASEVLGDLLGCQRAGIRVTTLRDPMCPRFHVDRVPCRMLMTIRGPGTEWIPSDDVDRALLADRSNNALPIRAGGAVRQFARGSWSLLKGGIWSDRFGGVVHRSPHRAGERLLLSLDPVFAD